MVKVWRKRWLMALAVLALAAGPCYGDGDGRLATAEERDFYRATQELLAAALPADVPEGWEITDQTEPEELGLVPTSAMPMQVEYGLVWSNVARQRQAEEQALTEISAAAETTPVSEAQIAEYEAMATKIAEAAAIGDDATVRQLQPQLEAQAEAINRALATVDEKIKAINRSAKTRDSQVSIRIIGNLLSLPLEAESKRTEIAGYPAFRRDGFHDSQGEWHEAVTWVFLGRGWHAPPGAGVYRFATGEAPSPASLQTVVVMIEADPARTETIAATIDWPSLQAALAPNAR